MAATIVFFFVVTPIDWLQRLFGKRVIEVVFSRKFSQLLAGTNGASGIGGLRKAVLG
jgi:hypothetical protein